MQLGKTVGHVFCYIIIGMFSSVMCIYFMRIKEEKLSGHLKVIRQKIRN
jgi:hypothetical protein